MREQFENYLERSQGSYELDQYLEAINAVSEHYSQQVSVPVDIFDLNEPSFKKLLKLYSKQGKFATFVTEQSLPILEALSMYNKMHLSINNSILLQAVDDFCNDSMLGEDDITFYKEQLQDYVEQQRSVTNPIRTHNVENDFVSLNFAYEKDLQKTLCKQVQQLFPEYQIYGGLNVGVEFNVATRRIDVLLEHKTNNSLLVVELKSGRADYKVFGQLSMYMGLVKREFPERSVQGLIIAGEIDDSLSQAAETNDNVKLMVYEMSIELKYV